MKYPHSPLRFCAARAAVAPIVALVVSSAAQAASTASLSVSDSASAAVGSVSTSVRRSSESASPDRRSMKDGEHRIVRVAPAPDAADLVQITLRPVADGEPAPTAANDGAQDWLLRVPRGLAEAQAFAAGQTITARTREYGHEFAAGMPRRAFFLALHDDWMQGLKARAVGS